jgi:DNA primase
MPDPRDRVWVNGGLCPFHDDHTPRSFFVNTQTGVFCCFACGTHGGDIIDYTRERYGLSFNEAVRKLRTEWEVGR